MGGWDSQLSSQMSSLANAGTIRAAVMLMIRVSHLRKQIHAAVMVPDCASLDPGYDGFSLLG